MRRLIGYQIADHFGENIQGEEQDPTGLPSFHVLTGGEAETAMAEDRDLLLMPIYEGDVEEPTTPAARYAETLGEEAYAATAEGDDAATFHGGPVFGDWRDHVPEGLRDAWPLLSTEARMAATAVAQAAGLDDEASRARRERLIGAGYEVYPTTFRESGSGRDRVAWVVSAPDGTDLPDHEGDEAAGWRAAWLHREKATFEPQPA